MKKNILKVALVAAVVATAGYGVYENQKQETMSDVMMENVEALASDEMNNKFFEVCYTTSEEIDCETYIEVLVTTTVTCPPRGNQDCSPHTYTSSTKLPKQ